jgi:Porphobilinogen deaminase, dipyromethane cofactor binding domain
LPQLNKEINIITKPIRGNVETRLKKLNSGEYDATILATAGLNRLLKPILNPSRGEGLSDTPDNGRTDSKIVKELLTDKRLMLLPLIECVPAPCQGAIVAEADSSNTKAVEILKAINDEKLFADCYAEKSEAVKYGTGCIQKFGVISINTKNGKYLYAAGKDAEGTEFIKWSPLPDTEINGLLFSSTDVMKEFFEYAPIAIGGRNENIVIVKQVVFLANYKSVVGKAAVDLTGKTIMASGTRTWFELAKQGYWVTASADALGFEFLLPSLQMPLFDIEILDIVILTHQAAAERWERKGYDALSNHRLLPKNIESVKESIAAADAIFWSSYSQYEFYGQYAKPGVKHLCAGGETAELLKQQGLQPVIFPTIKAFEQWRRSSIRSRSVA